MSAETAKSSTTMSGKIVETLGDAIVASLEATAQISLGQSLLRVADRFLWVVEKSAQWSLPVQEVNTEENGKTFGKIELVRPLPWIFFLPSLVMLRACRFAINLGAVILGYPTLQPTGMVKFIQKGRRRLRMIKSNGLKNIRHRKSSRTKEDELLEAKKSLVKSMLSTLSALSCLETSRRTPSPPPTRLYVQNLESDTTPTPEEKSTTESTSPQVDPKRKYSEVVGLDDSSEMQSEEESTEAKLERLAAADSDADDQDFDPADEELMISDSTSADDSAEEDDDYLSETELQELARIDCALNGTPKPGTAVDEVILEESESESEILPESGAKVAASEAPAATMNKISTPNKTAEELQTPKNLQIAKDNENNKLHVEKEHFNPVTPGIDGENNVKFYSPINSPDSTDDYISPVTYAKNDLISAEEQSNVTPSKIVKESAEAKLPCNEAIETNGETTISGNSTDGPHTSATMNGTNDENRSNCRTTTGKSHHKENQSSLIQQRKEK